MFAENTITKENLDFYLKELAKELRKRGGAKMPAEIILVGGASVIINYGFREMTMDIDAVIMASSCMKEAINAVGDRFNLPNGWINDDFKKTDSYSPRLPLHSEYYREYSHVLTVRTVKAEYLVAMKLVSGRRYKKDLSDIIGILYEQEKQSSPLDFDKINRAVIELYGSWDRVDDYSRAVLDEALKSRNLAGLFEAQMKEENAAKETVAEIEEKYPGTVNGDNINKIIEMARRKK